MTWDIACGVLGLILGAYALGYHFGRQHQDQQETGK